MANGSHKDSDKTSNGSYYNYMATSADTATSSKTSGDISDSICAKNWHVPSTNQQTVVKSYESIYGVGLRGFYNGTLSSVGSNGSYWSRTVISSTHANTMHENGGHLDNSSAVRYLGLSLRCLVK